jgi:hypothetical protein
MKNALIKTMRLPHHYDEGRARKNMYHSGQDGGLFTAGHPPF